MALTGWQELLRQGAGRIASTMLKFGQPARAVEQVLMARFPHATAASARAVVTRAQMSVAAGRIIDSPTATGPIDPALIPVDPTMLSRQLGDPHPEYRYEIVVQFIDPTTGREAFRSLTLDSDRNLGFVDVQNAALQMWLDVIHSVSKYAPLAAAPGLRTIGFDVTGVWRR